MNLPNKPKLLNSGRKTAALVVCFAAISFYDRMYLTKLNAIIELNVVMTKISVTSSGGELGLESKEEPNSHTSYSEEPREEPQDNAYKQYKLERQIKDSQSWQNCCWMTYSIAGCVYIWIASARLQSRFWLRGISCFTLFFGVCEYVVYFVLELYFLENLPFHFLDTTGMWFIFVCISLIQYDRWNNGSQNPNTPSHTRAPGDVQASKWQELLSRNDYLYPYQPRKRTIQVEL